MGGLVALAAVAAAILVVLIVLGIKYYGKSDTITKSTEEEDRVLRIKVPVRLKEGKRLVEDLTAAIEEVGSSEGDSFVTVAFYPDKQRIIWFEVRLSPEDIRTEPQK